ncbi:RagB/SusD family nutrient uptake outer membrane protein [termite gut metagenome]|uniref:RagB/SusD family nutrient uptake outer membrane protein n=1 Tax=termite gut metagenome TaxID=433724 RepID=A0A5J4RT57_9ZZZZ
MLTKIKNQWMACICTCILTCSGCSDYLNVVPNDGIATLETAFSMRSEAKKYLYTCYSYLPLDGSMSSDPSIMGGDEYWSVIDSRDGRWSDTFFRMARGFQNANSPLGGWNWEGLYQAIRVCNIFLENIGSVPDLLATEGVQWAAEVKFLKAYYHFYLVRMYGPIPIVIENLPISASPEEVRVSRDPVDDCFAYIVELLDQAIPDLPPTVLNPADELGRITKPIAAAWKAKTLVTAASPLFNGNFDQTTLVNKDGIKLFNPEIRIEKWESAMVACREAIEICHEANISLFEYQSRVALPDTLMRELTIRNAFTEKWNSEIIWANTHTPKGELQNLQRMSTPNLNAAQYPDNSEIRSQAAPTLKIAEMYYTSHGIPISEDIAWKSLDPFALREGDCGESEKYYIRQGYTTIQLHFDREPRFYACLGFDGGLWYGQKAEVNNPNPNSLFWVACRVGGLQQKKGYEWGPFTGYFGKKSVHYQNTQGSMTGYTIVDYPWPIMRLADLYLLYAEAINEVEGPNGANSAELFKYIDLIREKAGLKGVKYSWDNYADNKKYENQTGMRELIHRERLIELSLEGQRFWDLRRWKEAPVEYAKNIEGFNLMASNPAEFYQRRVLMQQTFAIRDYFWPIQISAIEQNPNLVQNIGW